MAYESLYNIDKRCVFRETFNSEADVIKNGGNISNVTFSNGIGSFNGISSIISYPAKNSIKSLIFIIDVKSADEQILKLSATHSISVIAGVVTATGFVNPVIYINGVLTSNIVTGMHEVVITTTTEFTADDINLGYTTSYGEFDIDLLEIYNTALSEEEVSNLYNKTTHKDIRDGLIIDIDTRNGIVEDRMGNALTYSGVSVKRRNVMSCFFDGSSTTGIAVPVTVPATDVTINLWAATSHKPVGTYYANFTLFGASGSCRVLLGNNVDSGISDTPTFTVVSNLNGGFKWSMYSFVIDAAGKLDVYLNGKLIHTIVSGQLLENPLFFGSFNNLYYRFVGFQNQQRIYNRALSSKEIARLYTSQKNNYE